MPLEAAGWQRMVGVHLGMCHRNGSRFHAGALSGVNSDALSGRLPS